MGLDREEVAISVVSDGLKESRENFEPVQFIRTFYTNKYQRKKSSSIVNNISDKPSQFTDIECS